MQKKVNVSVIIVNYKVEEELFVCIASIYALTRKTSFEIIVVDNDEEKTLESNLRKRFRDVVYISNPQNNGWGGGVNLGSKKAKGEYLYFLNPDTKLLNNALDEVYQYITKHKNSGVVASLLFDKNAKPYLLQGTRELTPFRSLVVYSSINRLFPNNPVAKDFFYKTIQRDKTFYVEIAPLTASLISKDLFEKVGKFDEQFFLYFEEYDLGRRIKKLGYQNYILPESHVLHYWESSTKQRSDRNIILDRSRFRYFKKHFGRMQAAAVETVLRRDLRMLVLK